MNEMVSQFDYSSAVMTRFLGPRHAGALLSPSKVITAQAGSRERGASVRLYFEIQDTVIMQARFLAYGCPHFLAAAEMLCEWCEGRAVGELSQWHWQSVQSELALPAAKRSKLLLLEDAVRQVAASLTAPAIT